MLKKYSVNDISKYFSIPKQTVRFYEDKGLIHSHRDPQNGYRFYTYEDINQIFDLVNIHPLNFKLQELNTLLNKADASDYQTLLRQKQQELSEQIKHLQTLSEKIEGIVHDIHRAQEGLGKPYELFTCPRIVICDLTDYSPHGVMFNNNYKENNRRDVYFFCRLSASGKVNYYKWGFGTSDAHQGYLVKRQLAVHEIVDLGPEGELVTRLNQKVEQYRSETKYTLKNLIVGKLLLRCHAHGIRQRYAEIWVPVDKLPSSE